MMKLPVLLLFVLALPGALAGQGAIELQPTEDAILLNLQIMDLKDAPVAGQDCIFRSDDQKWKARRTSNATGLVQVLIPKGKTIELSLAGVDMDPQLFQTPVDAGKLTMALEVKFGFEETISLDVHFRTGDAVLEASSESALMQLLEKLTTNPSMRIEIAGHTDDVGEAQTNLRLSQARADAVRTWLLEHGVSAGRISAKGYGESKPIADNATEEGRSRNRRTEVRIISQ